MFTPILTQKESERKKKKKVGFFWVKTPWDNLLCTEKKKILRSYRLSTACFFCTVRHVTRLTLLLLRGRSSRFKCLKIVAVRKSYFFLIYLCTLNCNLIWSVMSAPSPPPRSSLLIVFYQSSPFFPPKQSQLYYALYFISRKKPLTVSCFWNTLVFN